MFSPFIGRRLFGKGRGDGRRRPDQPESTIDTSVPVEALEPVSNRKRRPQGKRDTILTGGDGTADITGGTVRPELGGMY